jgi:hypothetical protein
LNGAMALGLQIQRPRQFSRQRGVGGGEPLQVPHLQHQPAGPCDRRQLVRLGQRGGDRLLHQHVQPGPQRRQPEPVMRLRRGRDHRRVAGRQQRVERQRARSHLRRHRRGPRKVRVEDP